MLRKAATNTWSLRYLPNYNNKPLPLNYFIYFASPIFYFADILPSTRSVSSWCWTGCWSQTGSWTRTASRRRRTQTGRTVHQCQPGALERTGTQQSQARIQRGHGCGLVYACSPSTPIVQIPILSDKQWSFLPKRRR